MKIEIEEQNVQFIRKWLAARRGLAVWNAADFSGRKMSTPLLDAEGNPYPQPTWWVDKTPSATATTEEEVFVRVWKEVKRFHVAVRMGSQGLTVKVTDYGSKRIRKECEKATDKTGKESSYYFDYESHENVVIQVQDAVVPLTEYGREVQVDASGAD